MKFGEQQIIGSNDHHQRIGSQIKKIEFEIILGHWNEFSMNDIPVV